MSEEPKKSLRWWEIKPRRNDFLTVLGNTHKISNILDQDKRCVEKYFQIAVAFGMQPSTIISNKEDLSITKRFGLGDNYSEEFLAYTFFQRLLQFVSYNNFTWVKSDFVRILSSLGLDNTAKRIEQEVPAEEPPQNPPKSPIQLPPPPPTPVVSAPSTHRMRQFSPTPESSTTVVAGDEIREMTPPPSIELFEVDSEVGNGNSAEDSEHRIM